MNFLSLLFAFMSLLLMQVKASSGSQVSGQLVSGPVSHGSAEEAEISSVLAELLTSKTGCEISERFFSLRLEPLQKYFGINRAAALRISENCTGKDIPPFSFIYKDMTFSRKAKTYHLHLNENQLNFKGWTGTDNQTHIFMETFDREELKRILAHELAITMDDKFFLQTSSFGLLGFPYQAPNEVSCAIDRFLANPFYQSLLASMRAYRMELRFAVSLQDTSWTDELLSYSFLDNKSVENFETFRDLMKAFGAPILKFHDVYRDKCSGAKYNIEALSDEELLQLVARDWNAVKSLLGAENLRYLMNFLIDQVAISSSDANKVNFGPRPVIGTGGWSEKISDANGKANKLNVTTPKRDTSKDNLESWREFHNKSAKDEGESNRAKAIPKSGD